MKLSFLFAATSALLVETASADQAGDCPNHKCDKPDWDPPCDVHVKTVTKLRTVYLEPETVHVTSTRTHYQPKTVDGVVRFTSTTSVLTQRSSTTITNTITSFNTVATSTKTVTRTQTIPRPKHFVPGKDTVYGWPEFAKRDVANATTEATEAAEDVSKAKEHERPEHGPHYHGL